MIQTIKMIDFEALQYPGWRFDISRINQSLNVYCYSTTNHLLRFQLEIFLHFDLFTEYSISTGLIGSTIFSADNEKLLISSLQPIGLKKVIFYLLRYFQEQYKKNGVASLKKILAQKKKEEIFSRQLQAEIKAVAAKIKPALRSEIKLIHEDYLDSFFRDAKINYLINKDFYVGFTSIRQISNQQTPRHLFYAGFDSDTLAEIQKISSILQQDLIKSEAEKKYLEKEKGRLLGYPPCCIQNYTDHRNISVPELVFLSFQNTRSRPHPALNFIDRDLSILSHIPCSFDCRASIRQMNNLRRKLQIISYDFLKFSYWYFSDGSYIRFYLKQSWILRREINSGHFLSSQDKTLAQQFNEYTHAYQKLIIGEKLFFSEGKEEDVILPFSTNEFVFIDFQNDS